MTTAASGHDRVGLRRQAPSAHAHCVPPWLSALIEVPRVVALPGRERGHGRRRTRERRANDGEFRARHRSYWCQLSAAEGAGIGEKSSRRHIHGL